MKLRLRGDSIRLRLSKSEVAALAERGVVEESVSFGGGARFTYAVVSGEALGATLSGARIEVSVARDAARAWAESDAVSLEGAQPADGGKTLRILVEKDFECLTARPEEDDSDAFDNPRAK